MMQWRLIGFVYGRWGWSWPDRLNGNSRGGGNPALPPHRVLVNNAGLPQLSEEIHQRAHHPLQVTARVMSDLRFLFNVETYMAFYLEQPLFRA